MTDAAIHPAAAKPARKRTSVYRHTRVTRVTHWINVVCLTLLLMSGLQILNAHPMLYWGQFGANADTPWLKFADGIPAWLTAPHYQDLATGRRWHFFFAWAFVINGLIYLTVGLINGHLARDIAPTRRELTPRHLAEDIWNHLRLKLPKGEAARRYNTLQKLAYLGVIVLVLPMIVLTGLTMSPGFNAVAPVLLDLFGGRQSARSLHFICANLIVAFVVVHVAMVFVAGAVNEIRSMFTGRYEIEEDRP